MKFGKNLLLILLAFLLCCNFVMPVTAAEEEEESMDTYVLTYGVPESAYDGPNMQYFSTYVTDYIYDGQPTYIQNNIFSLYHTITGEIVPAYCTDIKVAAAANNYYRRLNLEDSTYAASAAKKLRAIVLGGFYLAPIAGETMEEHTVRANKKLAELGAAAGVEGLTIGEAISATQSAIWKISHGSLLEYSDFVRTFYLTEIPSAFKYYDLCNEERENGHIVYTKSTYGQITVDPDNDTWINDRISTVYNYLLSLEPVSATSTVVSASSFVNLSSPVFNLNEDGTYDVAIKTTVDVDMAAGDSLTLKAEIGETYNKTAALSDGKQTLNLTIQNVPAELLEEEVTLSISGEQTASGVFLFDAYGDRESSQSMIGMDNSRGPVYAEVTATQARILNFTKTTNSGLPLEGISFDLFYIAPMKDYLSGKIDLPEPEDCPHDALAEYTVITDNAGKATMNFTQHGLPDGIYLVVERQHPAIVAPIKPFYVFMPAMNAQGTGYTYEISVYPKNEVKGNIKIEKDVTSIGNNDSTVNVYENHTWIISTNIPEDIGNGKSFTISDTLDNRLDYVGNVKVNVENTDGSSVITTLTADTDYTVDITDVDSLSTGKPSDSFILSLTQVGMSKIAASIDTGKYSDYALRVYFDAQINANVEMAERVPNKAVLEYTNSVNFTFNAESDIPVVYSGAANLLKVDSVNKKPLSDAVFEVYRPATDKEVAAGGDNLIKLKGVPGQVVKVSFFDNGAMHGEKVTSATSDENGNIAIYGLAFGKYYLVETQAPNGYNLLGDPLELNITDDSHTVENVVIVENIAGTVLPETGGIGTGIFTASGILLICVSVLLIFIKKRKAI